MLLVAIDGAPRGLDPVRLQKGMFLHAREGGVPPVERYWFVPYSYGPMSPALYGDLDALVRDGLVERRPVPGYSWSRYVATERGHAAASALAASAPAGPLHRLAEIKRRVAGLGFAALLSYVYARYPRYAARSVFRRS
jgi:uncharacterized protein YwgA